MTELKTEVIEADFQTKKVKNISVSPDTKPAKFLRDCAKAAKDSNVKSVMVMMVTAEDHVDHQFELSSEHHMALMALAMDDAREDLKNHIFNNEQDFD